MKVYISGPISGLTEDEYSTNFGRAEAYLLDKGHEPVNPLKVLACVTEDCQRTDGEPGGQSKDDGSYLHDWRCYMKHDIISMMDCESILMIPGWCESRGALIELEIARNLEYNLAELGDDYQQTFNLEFEEIQGVEVDNNE